MRASNFFWRTVAAVTIMAAAVVGITVADPPHAAVAANPADLDRGYLISDKNFYDGAAMTEGQIQEFLQAQVGTCQNWNCLARYTVDTPTRTWSFGGCATYVGARGESAARIIFKVQQACGLSAKVILVTLQKEQSLLTKSAPTAGDLQKAMGYGCPDTAECDSTYYGFFNQVFAAARQLTWYGNPQGSFTSIRVGNVNAIRTHPDCAGTIDVLIKNRATAALYYYTPYTPNNAAIQNLYGLGDGCSSYGNRNFWRLYSDWFGSPTEGRSPLGLLELRQAVPGGIRMGGWTFDPDTSAAIEVHAYVDGVGVARVANVSRPDVGAAYGIDANHGFDFTVPVTSSGNHNVCLYAINVLGGENTALSCFTIAAYGGDPIGNVDSITGGEGKVKVSGWAIDPDTASASTVHVYVDSVGTAIQANAVRGDVGNAYPMYGSQHGFDATISASPGTHNVCVYNINGAGSGRNTLLGCSTVTVIGEMGRAPIGVVDAVQGVKGAVSVSGWAIDLDSPSSISVHVYVDGVSAAYRADKDRPDVGNAYPGYGPKHGYTETVSASPGAHNVCVYGINGGPGGHTLLGCRSVVVPGISEQGRAPTGVLEGVTADSSGVTFSGWALDPDTESSIAIHGYVDGVGVAYLADKSRSDVGSVYSGYGDAHGFTQTVAAGPGAHTVCVYAINTGPGSHTLLGCRTVSVPGVVDRGQAPIGNFEMATGRPGVIDVGGWTIDPDTGDPIASHIYVDGVGAAYLADKTREDVAAAFPGYGPKHGIFESIAAAAGTHSVCVYGINNGSGSHTLLGCRSVTVPQ